VIVEIGVCDFETLAGQKPGIFVEPIKTYFDRLPANCNKENVAVSNYAGSIDIYYVPEHIIVEHGLDDWLRGCNSVNKLHPQHHHLPPEWIWCDTVPVVRIKSLLDKYAVTHIDLLKIDTEGHDTVILHDFLDTCMLRPAEILFESNALTPRHLIDEMLDRLARQNYLVNDMGDQCQALDSLGL
jgi:FkbM family methyltransferase